MSDFVKTTAVTNALEMAETVMNARPDARVGQIIGNPGTGKTAAGWHIQKKYRAIRICAWAKMGRKAMLEQIAQQLKVSKVGSSDVLTARLFGHVAGRMIIIDEANHLRWDVIESLRVFIDEYQAGLILIGTDLLERTFRSAQTEIYLAQMAQRIGAKRISFDVMKDASEIAGYVIAPRFGQVSAKTAKAFLKISKGNWRNALSLADACERVMRAEDISKLDDQLVTTAGAWMARNN